MGRGLVYRKGQNRYEKGNADGNNCSVRRIFIQE
jgi:hypothetical protein